MSDLRQHEADCHRFLGEGFGNVHRWMDECFSVLGPFHRRERHHVEGVDEARSLFGEMGARAAKIHVLRDCFGLPSKDDYKTGRVDPLGIQSTLSISDVVGFTDERVINLILKNLETTKTDDILLWGWLNDTSDLVE